MYQKVGDLFFKKNSYKKAIAAYEKAIRWFSSLDPALYLSLASAYEHLHLNFSAYEVFKKALELFLKNHAFDQALEISMRMNTLNPNDFFSHEKMGEIYVELGHTAEAFQEFKLAHEKAIAQNLYSKALLLLYYAFKLFPKNRDIWKKLRTLNLEKHNLAKLDILLGKPPEIDAQKAYETILKKIPQQEEAHQKAKEGLARIDKQKEIFFGQKESPSPEDLIRSLEEDLGFLVSKKETSAPIYLHTPLEELSADALYDVAIAYKEMGLFSEAISLLQKTTNKIPQTDFLKQLNHSLLMGMCYLENREFFNAISILEKTLYQNTLSFDKLPKEQRLALLYVLSQAFELSGNMSKALSCLRQIEKEDKYYRDIADKIRKIRTKITS